MVSINTKEVRTLFFDFLPLGISKQYSFEIMLQLSSYLDKLIIRILNLELKGGEDEQKSQLLWWSEFYQPG